MDNLPPPPNWLIPLRRTDGVRLRLIAGNPGDGEWEIVPNFGNPITLCPCCAKPMRSVRAAQLVANACVPLNEEPT